MDWAPLADPTLHHGRRTERQYHSVRIMEWRYRGEAVEAPGLDDRRATKADFLVDRLKG